jgi:hypothetical protein
MSSDIIKAIAENNLEDLRKAVAALGKNSNRLIRVSSFENATANSFKTKPTSTNVSGAEFINNETLMSPKFSPNIVSSVANELNIVFGKRSKNPHTILDAAIITGSNPAIIEYLKVKGALKYSELPVNKRGGTRRLKHRRRTTSYSRRKNSPSPYP